MADNDRTPLNLHACKNRISRSIIVRNNDNKIWSRRRKTAKNNSNVQKISISYNFLHAKNPEKYFYRSLVKLSKVEVRIVLFKTCLLEDNIYNSHCICILCTETISVFKKLYLRKLNFNNIYEAVLVLERSMLSFQTNLFRSLFFRLDFFLF